MAIESSGDQDAAERRTGPTVTRDRWINHARQKLAKGYVLIVSATRKNANFYSPVKGYEMCAYDVAKKLIAEGVVTRTRQHHLGDVYELSGPLPPAATQPRPRIEDDDDDLGAPDEFVEALEEEEDDVSETEEESDPDDEEPEAYDDEDDDERDV